MTVVIDAPLAAIERVIAKHAIVRQLLDHGWLHLWQQSDAGLQRYSGSAWQELQLGATVEA